LKSQDCRVRRLKLGIVSRGRDATAKREGRKANDEEDLMRKPCGVPDRANASRVGVRR
jgi:hypothetical protein